MEQARLEAASAWRLRQEQGLGPAEALRFRTWMADPDNAAAYGQVEGAWSVFDAPADAGLAAARERTRRRVSKRRAVAGLMKVAATVLVVAGGVGVYAAQAGRTYENDGRTPETVALADGSRLTLDGQTEVRVRFGPHGRRLDLERGQANFEVAHDAARPFEVHVGDTRVTALGTVFNIDRWDGAATITLLQGEVKVSQSTSWFGAPEDLARLTPGQQVTVEAHRASAVATVQTDAVSAWREGRLVFSDASLAQAVAGVNRHGGPPVSLADPALGRLRVSGIFEAGDSAAFAESVAKLHGLRAASGPDGITLASQD